MRRNSGRRRTSNRLNGCQDPTHHNGDGRPYVEIIDDDPKVSRFRGKVGLSLLLLRHPTLCEGRREGAPLALTLFHCNAKKTLAG